VVDQPKPRNDNFTATKWNVLLALFFLALYVGDLVWDYNITYDWTRNPGDGPVQDPSVGGMVFVFSYALFTILASGPLLAVAVLAFPFKPQWVWAVSCFVALVVGWIICVNVDEKASSDASTSASTPPPLVTAIPTGSYRVTEFQADELLEKTYDSAYCAGNPRFVHSGKSSNERFHVFDCQTRGFGQECIDRRFAAIKGHPRRLYRLKLLKRGHCSSRSAKG